MKSPSTYHISDRVGLSCRSQMKVKVVLLGDVDKTMYVRVLPH